MVNHGFTAFLFALKPHKSIDTTNKKPQEGQFVNGGNNASRFERLAQSYASNLFHYSKFKQLEQCIQVL